MKKTGKKWTSSAANLVDTSFNAKQIFSSGQAVCTHVTKTNPPGFISRAIYTAKALPNQEAADLFHKKKEVLKFYADKKRTEREFAVDDGVYLHQLQHFRHNSVVLRHNLELANKYYEPYKILGMIGKVAYKLELPAGTKIHNVIHDCLLKKNISPSHTPNSILPTTYGDGVIYTFPDQILSKRTLTDRGIDDPQSSHLGEFS